MVWWQSKSDFQNRSTRLKMIQSQNSKCSSSVSSFYCIRGGCFEGLWVFCFSHDTQGWVRTSFVSLHHSNLTWVSCSSFSKCTGCVSFLTVPWVFLQKMRLCAWSYLARICTILRPGSTPDQHGQPWSWNHVVLGLAPARFNYRILTSTQWEKYSQHKFLHHCTFIPSINFLLHWPPRFSWICSYPNALEELYLNMQKASWVFFSPSKL